MRCTCILATILVAVSTIPLGAQSVSEPQEGVSGLSISTSVDRNRITVGDPFLYLVQVKSPRDAAVEWPEPGIPPDGFELVSYEQVGPLAGPEDTNIDSLRYELTLYRTGEHTIAPLSLSCVLSNGTALSAVSDSIAITVVSVLDEDAADIRDLKAPVEIPDNVPWFWWVIGGLAALAAAAAVILYFRRRKGREVPTGAEAEIVRTPEEIALEELERLTDREWLEQGRVKAHYSALSEILRRYLSVRYGIAAMEYTTTELMASLNALEIDHENARAFRVLFEECDMVKFARFMPDAHRQAMSVPEGRDMVERSRPVAVVSDNNVDADNVSDEDIAAEASTGEDPGSVKDRKED